MSIVIPSLRAAIAVPPWFKSELWRRARAVPSLDLRFADNKSLVDAVTGASLVTFNRASGGTYTDSAGAPQTAGIDVPRFDHDPVTGESLGLLVEEERTNLLSYSGDITNDSWHARINVTVAALVDGAAPDGSTDGATLTATGVETFGRIISGTIGVHYTFSVWIRRRSGDGAITLVVGDNISVPVTVPYDGKWHRVSATNTPTTTSVRSYIRWGDPGESIDVWGAQLEEGSSPTSYIPTTTSAVTRSASLADLISGAIANNIRSFYVEFSSLAVGTCGVVSLNDNTAGERASVLTSGTDPRLVVQDGGVEQANINGGTVAAGAKTRVAVRINADDFAISINGGAVVTDTSGTLPTVDRLMFGRTQAGEYLNSRIARFTGWSQLLPNATLQTLA